MTRQKLTPPEIAKRYGCKPEKVIAWIRSGELRAMDASAKRGGRPRFLVDPEDLAAFEAARAVTPPPTTRRRKRSASAPRFYSHT